MAHRLQTICLLVCSCLGGDIHSSSSLISGVNVGNVLVVKDMVGIG